MKNLNLGGIHMSHCSGKCSICERKAWCNTYIINKYDINDNVPLYELAVKNPGTWQEPKIRY